MSKKLTSMQSAIVEESVIDFSKTLSTDAARKIKAFLPTIDAKDMDVEESIILISTNVVSQITKREDIPSIEDIRDIVSQELREFIILQEETSLVLA